MFCGLRGMSRSRPSVLCWSVIPVSMIATLAPSPGQISARADSNRSLACARCGTGLMGAGSGAGGCLCTGAVGVM